MSAGSETVAGIAGWKIIGGAAGVAAGGAGLASVVVMCMTLPRSKDEWVVALITTWVGSICGGAAVISYFDLFKWADNFISLAALLGLVFACGLPAWAIVRWVFNYINRHRDSSIDQIVDDVKGRL